MPAPSVAAERLGGGLRARLLALPFHARDDGLDQFLGLDTLPEDGPDLPRGCVPYLPCPVEALCQAAEYAAVGPADVFVDIGSGLGRAALFMHLWTGAAVVGIEVQAGLVAASRAVAARLSLPLTVIQGDAAQLGAELAVGSVFLLYAPFGGDRLAQVLAALAALARTRPIRICTVDRPLPPCPWLVRISPPAAQVEVYRSVGPLEGSPPSDPKTESSR